MTYIYSLSCPTTGEVRYVGKTFRLYDRKLTYLNCKSFSRQKNKRLFEWILELRQQGLNPVFSVIDHCDNKVSSTLEQFHINKYIHSGRLFNILLTSALHDRIDHNLLRLIAKQKKIRYQKLADALDVSYCSVAGYLTGQRCQLSLEKAQKLSSIIQSW